MIEFVEAFQRVLSILDRLEIAYYVCGSMASANYGFPRQTNDIDIVANFEEVDLREFCSLLAGDFYIDLENAERAVGMGRSFNAIHRKSVFKFDFFPLQANEFARTQLNRRQFTQSAMPGLGGLEFAVCTAEDSILSKLIWFDQGGRSSDQQWKDISLIVRVQGDKLDLRYLRKWAHRNGVAELLEEILSRELPSPAPEP